jgi:thiamine-phosphate pyrophosphorylase
VGLGVTVVTSAGLVAGRGYLDVALAAAQGGADLVQLRAKELAHDELLALARTITDACQPYGARVIVNDDVDVAIEARAGGVHLGQDELSDVARARLPSDALLGVSVGDADQARRADELGADYLGVTVFATGTKADAQPLGLAGLSAIVAATDVPVVGIGGIDAANARAVLGAGASGIAVVSYVGAADDMVAATRELVRVVQGG